MNGPQAAAGAGQIQGKHMQLQWRSRWESTNDSDPITLHTRQAMLRRVRHHRGQLMGRLSRPPAPLPLLDLCSATLGVVPDFQLTIALDTVYKVMNVPGRNTEMMHPYINAP